MSTKDKFKTKFNRCTADNSYHAIENCLKMSFFNVMSWEVALTTVGATLKNPLPEDFADAWDMFSWLAVGGQ